MTVPVAACGSSAVYLPVPDGEGHHVHRPDERGVPKKGRGGRPASERHQDQEQRACGHCDGNQSHECERESASQSPPTADVGGHERRDQQSDENGHEELWPGVSSVDTAAYRAPTASNAAAAGQRGTPFRGTRSPDPAGFCRPSTPTSSLRSAPFQRFRVLTPSSALAAFVNLYRPA